MFLRMCGSVHVPAILNMHACVRVCARYACVCVCFSSDGQEASAASDVAALAASSPARSPSGSFCSDTIFSYNHMFINGD